MNPPPVDLNEITLPLSVEYGPLPEPSALFSARPGVGSVQEGQQR